jgi:hypothetical protein
MKLKLEEGKTDLAQFHRVEIQSGIDYECFRMYHLPSKYCRQQGLHETKPQTLLE